jgi:hypothetical protein
MVMGEFTQETEVLVIGGGPGGYAAAFRAADLGLKVTMVDMEPEMGGVCLFRGCIPSKTLLHVSELLHDVKVAKRMGVDFNEPRVDLDRLREWKDQVVDKLAKGLAQLSKKRKVEYIQARAGFEDSHHVRLYDSESEVSHISFKHAIIATGSRPIPLPGSEFKPGSRIMDSGGALKLEEIPEKLLVVGGGYVGVDEVGRIIEDPRVKAVTLTGSVPAGRAVAEKAGAMLKKTVLELGGSDPYLILEDADLEEAVKTCVFSRLLNSGQSCIAAKRFVVVASQREQFEKLFTQRMAGIKMGDPTAEDTEVGPQARLDLREDLHRQVLQSIKRGARLLLGGEIPEAGGFFYPPTVLADVSKGMPAYDEELFGPVGAIVPVKDEKEAIQVANETSFGLGAAVFTKDVARGERIAAGKLEAGCCFVNDFVRSDPRLPFGGIKESGYGRELSHYGIKEFVNIKTVVVK